MKVSMILDNKTFKTFLKGLNVLVYEARWHFSPAGLMVRAVDPANVAMVISTLEEWAMESYILKEGLTIGVDVGRLDHVMKSFTDDKLDVSVEDSMLNVSSKNIRYSIALIDPSAVRREPKDPKLQLSAEVVMDAREFRRAIDAASKISDTVTFEVNDGFRITAKGDIESFTFEPEAEWSGQASSQFGVVYLQQFCKVAEGELTIRLGNNLPCRLTFRPEDGLTIEYLLAPRVEA